MVGAFCKAQRLHVVDARRTTQRVSFTLYLKEEAVDVYVNWSIFVAIESARWTMTPSPIQWADSQSLFQVPKAVHGEAIESQRLAGRCRFKSYMIAVAGGRPA